MRIYQAFTGNNDVTNRISVDTHPTYQTHKLTPVRQVDIDADANVA